jgi:hypothetical protein
MEADVNERTATLAMEALDKDRWAVKLSVQQIMGVLQDFIPRACHCEASDRLFDAFFINGTELTSNMMRKEYEHWKQLQLESMFLQANPIFKVQP